MIRPAPFKRHGDVVTLNLPSPPPGFRLRWIISHILLCLLYALVGCIPGLAGMLPEPYKSGPPWALFLLGLIAPKLPKLGETHNQLVNTVLGWYCSAALAAYAFAAHVRKWQVRYLRLALAFSIPGAWAGVYLVNRATDLHHAVLSEKAQTEAYEQELDEIWSRAAAYACDGNLADNARSDVSSICQRIRGLTMPPSERLTSLQELATALEAVFPQTLTAGTFPGHCAIVAQSLRSSQLRGTVAAPLIALLSARLYLRASQNGMDQAHVERALSTLDGPAAALLGTPASSGGPAWSDEPPATRLAKVAFFVCRGTAMKLQAAGTVRRARLDDNKPLDVGKFTTGLNAAQEDYDAATSGLTDDPLLQRMSYRLKNNKLDLRLLVYSLLLDARLKAFLDDQKLDPIITELVRRNRSHEKLKSSLRDECKEIVATLGARQDTPIMITVAQAHCLLADALSSEMQRVMGTGAQTNGQPVSADRIEKVSAKLEGERQLSLDMAYSMMMAASVFFDEIDVLMAPEDYHLGALARDIDYSPKFEALRKRAHDGTVK